MPALVLAADDNRFWLSNFPFQDPRRKKSSRVNGPIGYATTHLREYIDEIFYTKPTVLEGCLSDLFDPYPVPP